MNLYQAYRETLNSKPILLSIDEPYVSFNPKVDHYHSLYYYTPEHLTRYNKTNTLAGIKDTITNRLYFDFDNKDNLDQAKEDALTLGKRLLDLGIPEDSIKVFWTGGKGFAVEIILDHYITPEEFKTATFNLAQDLKSFDKVVNDPNRIVRLPNTRHQKTGLYKIQLTSNELHEMSIDEIKELSKEPRNEISSIPTSVPYHLFETPPEVIPVSNSSTPLDIDFTKKAKGWSNCKWSILNGNFKSGNRHYPVTAIIATCKSLNYPKETAYYMAKSACKFSAQRNNEEEFPKSEIWTIVESVYKDSWRGGAFSCKEGSPWLTEICNGLDHNKCDRHEAAKSYIEVDKVFNEFQQFAKDIDKNTIKTGIDPLDKGVRLRTGQMIGILGSPSSGKTALALEILENTSRQNLLSVFYSLDMSSSELFQKIAQRVTGHTEDYLFNVFQNDEAKALEIRNLVSEAYRNVHFCFDTGISADKIETSIQEFQEQTGKTVKLLLLDYNELLSSPHSDSTASSGHNAGALKRITNLYKLCTISLLQPPKVIGDASDEINSYRAVKGSSLLEQCFSIIIGIYRPGFSAKNDSIDDKFLIMNVLKNRLGKLFHLQFGWEGLKGRISELDEIGLDDLSEVIQRKNQEKSEKQF